MPRKWPPGSRRLSRQWVASLGGRGQRGHFLLVEVRWSRLAESLMSSPGGHALLCQLSLGGKSRGSCSIVAGHVPRRGHFTSAVRSATKLAGPMVPEVYGKHVLLSSQCCRTAMDVDPSHECGATGANVPTCVNQCCSPRYALYSHWWWPCCWAWESCGYVTCTSCVLPSRWRGWDAWRLWWE